MGAKWVPKPQKTFSLICGFGTPELCKPLGAKGAK